MKEATGELNMTVITVVAIAAVAALFYAVVWPMIQKSIIQKTCDSYGSGYVATKQTGTTNSDKMTQWLFKGTYITKCKSDVTPD